MNDDQLELLKVNRNLMWFVGIWPHQKTIERFLMQLIVFPIMLMQLILQGGGMITAWTVGSNLDVALENFAPFMISWLCIVKLVNFMYNADKMKSLLCAMESDWRNHCENKTEINILIEYYKLGKKLTLGYGACVYGSMAPFMVLPVVPIFIDVFGLSNDNSTQERLLLFHVEYFVDVEKYYYLVLIHSYFGTISFITTVVAVDTMLVTYIQHICGLITILGHRLERLVEEDSFDIQLYPEKNSDKSLITANSCVVMHNRIINYATTLESANTVSFFLQLGISMICISFTGFQAVMKLDNPDESFRYASFVLAQTFQLFCECWPSQQLYDHSIRVCDYATSGKWYLSSLSARKTLNIMIMRSLKPLRLTAGKFFIMNLQSFSSVVRTSFSYFTVLCSVQ